MRVFITGVTGQLGHDVMLEAARRGYKVIGAGRRLPDRTGTEIPASSFLQIELSDATAVRQAVSEAKPDAIIHCAAWTDVDGAEDAGNSEKVRASNVTATENLAKACGQIDAKMIYISTDYVFDGQGERPWEPDDRCFHPLNVYGQSKLDGELAVEKNVKKFFVVRTAWVFGRNGKNFVRTMLRIGKTHDNVRVVDDQIGTPTYTKDLARLLMDMIETEKYGFYHATNSEEKAGEYISWADFTEEIYRQAGMDVRVTRVSTAEYGLSKAVRPLNSRLDKRKLAENGFQPLPSWKDALHRYLTEIGEV